MNILVCIIGTLRGGHIPCETLKRHILDPYNADLLLCITKNKDNRNYDMMRLATYVFEHEHQVSMENAFDNAMKTKWSSPCLQRTVWNHANMIYYRWLLKQDLIKHNIFTKYDYFIVTRSDNVYINSNFPFIPHILSIPIVQDYKGICDRFMIVDASNVILSLSIMEFIFEKRKLKSHIEKMLAFFFENNQFTINRFQKNHFIIMRNKENNLTPNRNGIPLNSYYKIKYAGEYADCYYYYKKCIENLNQNYNFNPYFTIKDFSDAEDRKRDTYKTLI